MKDNSESNRGPLTLGSIGLARPPLGLPHVSAGARRGAVDPDAENRRLGLPTAAAAAELASRRERLGSVTHADVLASALCRWVHDCAANGPDDSRTSASLGRLLMACADAMADAAVPRRVPAAAQVRVHLDGGGSTAVTAYPERDGWHACPPCGSTVPVYARPTDAALAHVRNIGSIPIGAEVVLADAPPPAPTRAAPEPCDCAQCGGTHRVVNSMGRERPCDYCACAPEGSPPAVPAPPPEPERDVFGSTRPPTPREAEAHAASGGFWLLVMAPTMTAVPVEVVKDPLAGPLHAVTLFVPLDRLWRPTRWPRPLPGELPPPA